MTATAITPTNLTAAALAADPAGTTYDNTNGMVIAGAQPERTVYRLTNTDASTPVTFTFKAGDYPPALAAGQGDLAFTIPVSSTKWVGPIESGRIMQSDGSVQMTASTNTGKISAFLIPRNA